MNPITLTRPASPPSPERCPRCGEECVESLRHCTVCSFDLGCPNVRAAQRPPETEEVAGRFRAARESSKARGLSNEFENLVEIIENESHVVIAITPILARTLIQDPRTLYQGYENLVEVNGRTPAPQESDTQRYAVTGKLFGHYANDIRYGSLSINGRSLKNYGIVFIQLRDIAIMDRVSFLHENSYLFAREFGIKADSPFPLGYRCSWLNKKDLAAAKLEPHLVAGSGKDEWAKLLVSDGESRDMDRCVEAHIYGPFSASAIESIEFETNGINRQDRTDIEVIRESFGHKKASGWQS